MELKIVRRFLVVAALTGLLVAGVVAVEPLGSSDEPRPSLVVPSWGFSHEADFVLTSPEFGSRQITWIANGPMLVNDSIGRPHRTLSVAWGEPAGGGKIRQEWRESGEFFFDLQTRDVVRYESFYGGWRGLLSPDGSTRWIELGPGLRVASQKNIAGGQDVWVATVLQGRTLWPGQDLTDLSLTDKSLPTLVGDAFSHRFWVDRTALVDGETAMAVRMENEWTRNGPINGLRTLVETRENRTFWFTGSSPVPVLVESERFSARTVSGEGRVVEWKNRTLTLTAFRVSRDPIPWPQPAQPQPIPQGPDPVRAPFPPSGDGFRGDLRLEDAVAAALADPTLWQFSEWKATNPGYRLVGAGMWPKDARLDNLTGQRATVSWRLRFSAPFGATVALVETERLAGGAIVSAWKGLYRPPESLRFDPKWMPDAFVPMAHADDYWRRLVPSDVYEAGPNSVLWGYPPEQGWYFPDKLHSVVYGRWSGDAEVIGLVPDAYDSVYMSVDSGRLWGAEVMRSYPGATRLLPGALPATSGSAPNATPDSAPSILPLLGGAAGLSLLLLLAYLYPLVQQGFLSLYTKLVKHQLLDHELRDRLVTIVRQTPGASVPKMRQLTGAGWSTILYHLRVLQDAGLVTTARVGRHRCYFPTGLVHHGYLPAAATLQNPNTRQVYDLVLAQPGIDRVAVGKLLGWTPSGALWHLGRLVRCGLVREEKGKRPVRYFPSQDARAATLDVAPLMTIQASRVPNPAV